MRPGVRASRRYASPGSILTPTLPLLRYRQHEYRRRGNPLDAFHLILHCDGNAKRCLKAMVNLVADSPNSAVPIPPEDFKTAGMYDSKHLWE
ncbi:hypothetical protein BHE74_00028441 [Ensete ventricosum]|nr:hypothetical protein BHE74_00028441 [Ensete ventricosum]